MNIAKISILTGCLIVLCAGCASQKGDLERGWIGGNYVLAKPFSLLGHGESDNLIYGLPKDLPPGHPAGVLITALSTNSPAARAGIAPGDLIIDVAGKPVRNLPDFRAEIDQVRPGSSLSLAVYRDGKVLEKSVVVGRERYREERSFCAVLVGVSSHLDIDLIPDPNFSLIALGYNRDDHRVELDSVRTAYSQRIAGTARDGAVESNEGWKSWVGPINISAHKRILAQQSVEPKTVPVSNGK